MKKVQQRSGGVVAAVGLLAALGAAAGCRSQSSLETAPEPTRTESALGTINVLTQHNDVGRTGANLNETQLNITNVKTATFGKLTSLTVSGQVYAQPLYASAAISGKNVIFIATEANKVYAYNADAPYNLLWSRTNFEAPWSSTACANTQPLLGISSTPVIDPATSSIYVVTKTNAGGTFKSMLHVLNMTTGADKVTAIDMGKDAAGNPLQVNGTGNGSSGGKITFDPMRHQNRVGLTLSPQGVLSVGFAAHCDQDNYHGWLLRFDTTVSPPRPLTPYMTNPNTGHGGLWMGGAGFSMDPANGDLYFISGDGRAGLTNTNGTQLANAFIKLTNLGITGTPTVASWFMPSDVAALDTADADIGSSGPLLIPGTTRIVGGGKNGILYVLNKDNMGGFVAGSTPETQIVQRFSASTNNGQIVGSPIWWESPAGPRLYVWPGKAPLAAFAFNRTTNTFNTTAVAKSVDNPTVDPQGGHMSLSANGSTAGTGIVWATHPLASTGGGAAVSGVLYAFNAENVAQTLWTSAQGSGNALASASKYIPPTVANGKVYVGTFSDKVEVYGLLSGGSGGSGGTGGSGGAGGAGGDSGPLPIITCANVDGGAPQPTNWTYLFNTYFAGTTPVDGGTGTPGHCQECHTSTLGGFICGLDKDQCYAGLVASGKVSPDAGTTSVIGDPHNSPLAWFDNPVNPPGVLAFMPTDQAVRNARAVAAVCGWVAAGARNDKTAGQTCGGANECASGFCVDGVCCGTACGGSCMACSNARTGQASGTCAAISSGGSDTRCVAAPPCGNDGTCNGAGQCKATASGTSCGAASSCSGGVVQPATTCNGSGSCVTPPSQTCSPYLCGATACTTSCVSNGDCAVDSQCLSNQCVVCPGGVCCAAGQQACGGTCTTTSSDPNNCGGCGIVCGGGQVCAASQCRNVNGTACTAGAQCASGSCVDNFCCNAVCNGTCNACSAAKTGAANGTCATTLAGTADARCGSAPPCGNTGLCATGGACQVAPNTTSCRSASCTSGVATAAATCNGAGACPTAVTSACTPYICGPTACKTTCAADSDCISADFCSANVCTPKKATGTTCTAATQCGSGFCSNDGICCSGSCSLTCQGCSNANTGLATGTCGPKTTPAGTNVCSNMCVNTLTDAANCGSCGHACGTGSTCTNGTCSTAACTTTNALIDNYEDNNNVLSLLESRNGKISTFKDSTGTTITPASTANFTSATPGNGGSARAAHFTGHINNTSPVWAGLGFDYLNPRAVYNASKYTGFTFYAKKASSTSTGALRLKVPDKNTDPAGGVCTSCSNDFGADITLTTTWTQYTVRFATMTQQTGWGAPRPAKIDATQLYGIKFQFEAKNTNFDIWIDDVKFICN